MVTIYARLADDGGAPDDDRIIDLDIPKGDTMAQAADAAINIEFPELESPYLVEWDTACGRHSGLSIVQQLAPRCALGRSEHEWTQHGRVAVGDGGGFAWAEICEHCFCIRDIQSEYSDNTPWPDDRISYRQGGAQW